MKITIIGFLSTLVVLMTACSAQDQELTAGEASTENQVQEEQPVLYYNPVWSPDGSRIAFYSNRDGNFEIYTIHPDGTNLRRLTHSDAGDGEMTWSPDGSQIVFSSNRDGPNGIYVMNTDGSDLVRLSDTARVAAPAWSPEGTKIAYESRVDGNRDLFVMNADGSNQRRLTQHPLRDFGHEWSVDGSEIYFRTERNSGYWDIAAVPVGGGDVRMITESSMSETAIQITPDGSTLVYVGTPRGNSIVSVNIASLLTVESN